MKAYIAGGCQEHGRNSFMIQGDRYSVLIDCGIMKGSEKKYPYLTNEQIKEIRYLFLTHIHKDHVGALDWLYQRGFCGTVYLSTETYEQMKLKPQNYVLLDPAHKNEIKVEKDFIIQFGRSGHCTGSLWFVLSFCGKNIVFTGDYCEDSRLYYCDCLRNTDAHLAFVDCAYGEKTATAEQNRRNLLKEIDHCFTKDKCLLLPVPENGRAFDLIDLLSSSCYAGKIYVDDILMKGIKKSKEWRNWIKPNTILQEVQELKENVINDACAILVADPQLKQENDQVLAQKVLEKNGEVLFTGHIDLNSYASILIHRENVLQLIYNVHENLQEALALCEKNHWSQIIFTHCDEELVIKNTTKYLNLKTREKIEI